MKALLNKARVLLTTWFSYMSAYRAEIIIWILTGSVPLIMLAVWIGKAEAAGGSMSGFTAPDFAAYFLSAWLSLQFTIAWVAWELDYQIRQGELSPKLLRPLDVFWDHIAAHLAERIVRLPIIVAVITCGLLLVPGTRLTPSPLHAVVFLLSITLAWFIRFQLSYIIGTITFWMDRATALDEFYHIIAIFLTGTFAPLDFYPSIVRNALDWTPFPYIIYYPVRILNGALDWPTTIWVLGVQALWVVGFWVARTWLWQRGLRRYGAVGA